MTGRYPNVLRGRWRGKGRQDSSKKHQDRPNRLEDHLKKPQDSPNRPENTPKKLQDQPKRLPREIQGLPRPLQAIPKTPPKALRGFTSPPKHLSSCAQQSSFACKTYLLKVLQKPSRRSKKLPRSMYQSLRASEPSCI